MMIHMCVCIYLFLDLLCAYHLVRQISFLVLYGKKTPFSYIFHDKTFSLLYSEYLAWHVLFRIYLLDWASCFPALLNVCLWATCILKETIGVTILCLKDILLMQTSCFYESVLFFTSPSSTGQISTTLPRNLLVPSARIDKALQQLQFQVYSHRPKLHTSVLPLSHTPSLAASSFHHPLAS